MTQKEETDALYQEITGKPFTPLVQGGQGRKAKDIQTDAVVFGVMVLLLAAVVIAGTVLA